MGNIMNYYIIIIHSRSAPALVSSLPWCRAGLGFGLLGAEAPRLVSGGCRKLCVVRRVAQAWRHAARCCSRP